MSAAASEQFLRGTKCSLNEKVTWEKKSAPLEVENTLIPRIHVAGNETVLFFL